MREACGLPWLLGFSVSIEKFFLLLTQPLLLFCCIYFLLGWLGVACCLQSRGLCLRSGVWKGLGERSLCPARLG